MAPSHWQPVVANCVKVRNPFADTDTDEYSRPKNSNVNGSAIGALSASSARFSWVPTPAMSTKSVVGASLLTGGNVSEKA